MGIDGNVVGAVISAVAAGLFEWASARARRRANTLASAFPSTTLGLRFLLPEDAPPSISEYVRVEGTLHPGPDGEVVCRLSGKEDECAALACRSSVERRFVTEDVSLDALGRMKRQWSNIIESERIGGEEHHAAVVLLHDGTSPPIAIDFGNAERPSYPLEREVFVPTAPFPPAHGAEAQSSAQTHATSTDAPNASPSPAPTVSTTETGTIRADLGILYRMQAIKTGVRATVFGPGRRLQGHVVIAPSTSVGLPAKTDRDRVVIALEPAEQFIRSAFRSVTWYRSLSIISGAIAVFFSLRWLKRTVERHRAKRRREAAEAREAERMRQRMLSDSYRAEQEGGALAGDSCVVCMERAQNTAILPCGHLATCFVCACACEETDGRCPICRAHIEKILRVYRS